MTRRPFPTASIRRASRRSARLHGSSARARRHAAGGRAGGHPCRPRRAYLVVTANGDGFASYLPEILRGEGLDEFDVLADIGSVWTPDPWAGHHVVVLGHTSLSDAQVAMFSAWVQSGGNLVAMRPDKKLAGAARPGRRRRHARRRGTSYVPSPGRRHRRQECCFHGSADLYGAGRGEPGRHAERTKAWPKSRR